MFSQNLEFCCLFGLFLSTSVISSSPIFGNVDPEVYMNASELITSKGYPCENYEVETEDGFILGVQRIPHSRNDNHKTSNRPVVFLQHGLLCSSTNWLTNLVNESFAYLLADAGYDVWMGNIRGNTYSRKHVKYNPYDKEFWSWSWDQMAEYDVPAMINFVLKKTNQPNLYYVGHSQGTLIMFAHLSQHPEFSQKIKRFFALGPVATVQHIESPFYILAYYTKEITGLFDILGVKEFLPSDFILKELAKTFCRFTTRIVCENVLFILAGFDSHQLNATRLPVYLSHTPAGTSVQNMVHFAQGVRSGAFQMYDYGSKKENVNHYRQTTPPLYNASRVNVPVVIFSAQNDWLADPWDVEHLESQLPDLVYQEEIASWDHLDFIWGMDAAQLVYSKVINMMKKLDVNVADRYYENQREFNKV